MRGHRRALLTLVAGVVAAMLGGASLAWACTAQARIMTLDPVSGAEGTVVTMGGDGFRSGPVEIRWDSPTGPVIGMALAEGGSFVTSVAIPEAAPGQHVLFAVPGGTLFFSAREAFVVTAPTVDPRDSKPAPPPATTDPGVTDPDVDPGQTGPLPSETVPGVPSVPVGPGPAPASGPAPGTVTPAEPTPQLQAPAVSVGQPVRPAPASAADRSTAPPAVAGQPAAADDRLPPVASADLAPVGQISADLWSGFASGADASPAPSLVDVPTDGGPTSGLALGIALLVAGLVALVTAGGATVLTRRRVRASSAA